MDIDLRKRELWILKTRGILPRQSYVFVRESLGFHRGKLRFLCHRYGCARTNLCTCTGNAKDSEDSLRICVDMLRNGSFRKSNRFLNEPTGS